MYYMGFHDLFDHLLEDSRAQCDVAAISKDSSIRMQSSSAQPGWSQIRTIKDRRVSKS